MFWRQTHGNSTPEATSALPSQPRANSRSAVLAPVPTDHGCLVRGSTEGWKGESSLWFSRYLLILRGTFSGVSQTPTDTLMCKAYKLCRKDPKRCSLGIPVDTAIRGCDGKGRGLWASGEEQRSHTHQDGGGAGRSSLLSRGGMAQVRHFRGSSSGMASHSRPTLQHDALLP